MGIRICIALSGAVLLMMATTTPSLAEDKIQAFVSPSGKIVFTNLADNTPGPVTPTAVPATLVKPESTVVLSEEMPENLKSLVDTISSNHGVDPGLVRAVMKTESNFNRWAVSPKGARGLMQLIPATGHRYGVRDFFDPQQNVDGGVRYLKFLLEKFNGNIDLSLAAYNAGENLVARLGRIPAIPETTNYVRKIRAIYKKSSVPVGSAGMIEAAVPTETAAAAPAVAEVVKDEAPRVFRVVDERGVTHFSNIEPRN